MPATGHHRSGGQGLDVDEDALVGGGGEKSVTSPLSLIVSGFAPVADIRQTLTPQLRLDKGATDPILVDLGRGQNRMGASILAQVYGQIGRQAPDVDDAEDLQAFFAVVQGLNADGLLLAYHDRSDGGLLTTVLEWPSPVIVA